MAIKGTSEAYLTGFLNQLYSIPFGLSKFHLIRNAAPRESDAPKRPERTRTAMAPYAAEVPFLRSLESTLMHYIGVY